MELKEDVREFYDLLTSDSEALVAVLDRYELLPLGIKIILKEYKDKILNTLLYSTKEYYVMRNKYTTINQLIDHNKLNYDNTVSSGKIIGYKYCSLSSKYNINISKYYNLYSVGNNNFYDTELMDYISSSKTIITLLPDNTSTVFYPEGLLEFIKNIDNTNNTGNINNDNDTIDKEDEEMSIDPFYNYSYVNYPSIEVYTNMMKLDDDVIDEILRIAREYTVDSHIDTLNLIDNFDIEGIAVLRDKVTLEDITVINHNGKLYVVDNAKDAYVLYPIDSEINIIMVDNIKTSDYEIRV